MISVLNIVNTSSATISITSIDISCEKCEDIVKIRPKGKTTAITTAINLPALLVFKILKIK